MASVSAIVRQIEREGLRWGLFPLVRDGKVFVAERIPVAYCEPGHGLGYVDHKLRAICSIDEENTFANVLRNRIERCEADLAERAAERDAALAREQAAGEEARSHTYRGDIKRLRRGRIMSLPTRWR
jgi:uncharacterized small protein (DUF1192 family)